MKQIGKQEFAALVIKYRQNFYRIAYSYVKNEQDALDIVSEATCKGLSHLRDLREPDYFKTWMTRIVINTALTQLRKGTRMVAFEDYMLDDFAVSESGTEVNFDLYDALEALEAEEKTFIILKYFEEYSFREMAALLGQPESTLKSKTYRCLGKMRRYMEGGVRTC